MNLHKTQDLTLRRDTAPLKNPRSAGADGRLNMAKQKDVERYVLQK